MSSSKNSGSDFISDSSTKTIKDEIYDCDISEISPLQTNDIDYTITDSGIDLLQTKNQYSKTVSLNKSLVQKKKLGPVKRKWNLYFR